ncbi:hypothetical protein LLH06_11980 [Mucilaginibacter daejeonensis]|uniref:hypothetical protein n=1 Tax=Mucilaginibacter daejeonensis TaxID=398049 RepID=UPI001D17685C|nr:hypothetical protein [Mucilaginibacter daejeonensis]UEG51688.1 hypothetical protein LLH06_11980 [Mucilaginibacter daejeonensis]
MSNVVPMQIVRSEQTDMVISKLRECLPETATIRINRDRLLCELRHNTAFKHLRGVIKEVQAYVQAIKCTELENKYLFFYCANSKRSLMVSMRPIFSTERSLYITDQQTTSHAKFRK